MTGPAAADDPVPAGLADACVLAVDLGTGGPKVAVVSGDGKVLAHAFVPVGLHLFEGGGAEQDPDEWWAAITAAARRAVAEAGVEPDRFVGVGCTGQWSGTVAVDAAGEAVAPAVIWMDSRGHRAVRRAVGGPVTVLGYHPRKALRWIRTTGGAPGLSGKDPLAHVLYLRDEHPDVYERTATFLEPVDYLNLRLTGRACASYDSIAVHWVTDNRRVGSVVYDDTLLAWSGLDRARLPDLVPPGSIVGTVTAQAAAELGIPAGVPVASASGDVHSAVVGSGAVEDFAGHLYIGTSSWISAHVPFKKTSVRTNVASIPAALAGKYLVADEHETAGACLTFAMEALGIADFDEVAALVEAAPPGSGKVLFTPWLNGERSPVDDHTVRGGFHNLSLSTTRAELVRAVLEGVALNSRWLLDAVERFCGRRFETLAFVGGGARSDQWCQVHADVLGRRIVQMAEPVLANVRGAALLALVALGRVTVDRIPSLVEAQATYEPDASLRPRYDELFTEFVTLYRQTKGVYRRLNGG